MSATIARSSAPATAALQAALAQVRDALAAMLPLTIGAHSDDYVSGAENLVARAETDIADALDFLDSARNFGECR